MLKAIKTFLAKEDGAITVDWVVLTAVVVGLQVIILVTTMRESLVDVSGKIGGEVSQFNDYLNSAGE